MKNTLITTRRFDGDGNEVYRLEERPVERHLPRRERSYEGPWECLMQLSIEGVREVRQRLKDHSMGMQAMCVLLAMIESVAPHSDNKVRAGRKDLARMLDMDQAAVHRSIKTLVELGFVEAPAFRFDPYVISPRLFWNSSTKRLRHALKDRGMLDKDGMMAPRQAA